MSALLASLAGVGLALGVAVPLATLAVLGWFRRTRHANAPIERRGSTTALLLLLAPSLGALLWLVSAALHLAEPGGAHAFCALDHGELETCVDALLFAGLLTGVMAASVGYRATRPRGGPRALGDVPSTPPAGERQATAATRLRRALERPELAPLEGRAQVVATAAHPICARGLWRPRVEVTAALVARLDDAALRAALLHELAHVEARDPLRYLLGSASLLLNPAGALLRRELGRWRACREVLCDAEAVRRSADPLALASALVWAARLEAHPNVTAAGGVALAGD
ncbi:MAG: hypothetical protein KC543_09040, partial [Myxococcales bacterium]|nr:hypothetical protein [Myxococcales bacterium]